MKGYPRDIHDDEDIAAYAYHSDAIEAERDALAERVKRLEAAEARVERLEERLDALATAAHYLLRSVDGAAIDGTAIVLLHNLERVRAATEQAVAALDASEQPPAPAQEG